MRETKTKARRSEATNPPMSKEMREYVRELQPDDIVGTAFAPAVCLHEGVTASASQFDTWACRGADGPPFFHSGRRRQYRVGDLREWARNRLRPATCAAHAEAQIEPPAKRKASTPPRRAEPAAAEGRLVSAAG